MKTNTTDAVQDWIAQSLGRTYVSDWLTVDQSMISRFADVTQDWTFLHVDEDAARSVGLEGTIAHGFLSLSLLSVLRESAQTPRLPGITKGFNYGLDRVRFLEPVSSGARVRGHFSVAEIVGTGPGRYRQTLKVSVEIEGRVRPALVADWLIMAMT